MTKRDIQWFCIWSNLANERANLAYMSNRAQFGKTRERAATLRARRKVAREDDREHARRKKIMAGSTLANYQLNYVKPLKITYF